MDPEEIDSQLSVNPSILLFLLLLYFSYHSSGEEEEDEDSEDSTTDSTHSSLSLLHAVKTNDAVGVQQALRNGANVNASIHDYSYDDDDIPDTSYVTLGHGP